MCKVIGVPWSLDKEELRPFKKDKVKTYTGNGR